MRVSALVYDPSEADPQGRLFGAIYRRGLLANAIGAAVAFVYLGLLSPPQPPPPHAEDFLYTAVAPVYLIVAAWAGYVLGKRDFRPVARWLREQRVPTDRERDLILSWPWRTAVGTAAGWLGAAAFFGAVTATHHPAVFVTGMVVGILLAGLVTTTATFLLVERTLRPLFVSALAGDAPSENESLGRRVMRTRPRLLIAWSLGSGVALLAIPLAFLGRSDSTGEELVVPVLFLVLAGLFAGGALTSAAARSISDPLERLRAAQRRVEEGSFDEALSVDDAGEIGLLEAGFNRMVAGLRERERIREALGTYVDREVADHILREGTSLAGEEVEVTVLFLDVRGFTSVAERLSAPEVVTTLNRLFELTVPIVHAHGGHVDKYVGDGLLAVFGAPRRQPDHADQAVGAALEIDRAVEAEFGTELQIGIGVNSGIVVAGNVGGAGRLEFSVIGDAVNVAARVEAATRETGDTVLVTGRTRELLQVSDVSLEVRPRIVLKGKREPVDLYSPCATSHTHRAGLSHS